MKKLTKLIPGLSKKVKRLEKRLCEELREAHDKVTTAITHEARLEGDDIICFGHYVARVDQTTGEIVDYLVHFPDFDKIAKISGFLDAYLITNQDVLDSKTIDELESLINYLP